MLYDNARINIISLNIVNASMNNYCAKFTNSPDQPEGDSGPASIIAASYPPLETVRT
jgi:hypothetical protein